MVDNFDKYKEFIDLFGGLPNTNEKGNLDKYYVVELIRRGKDNPDIPASNYHFKNYYIYSWKDLYKYKNEIKSICTLLHLRAYGSVNYKLMSQVSLDALAESSRRIALHDYKKFYSIFESCSGKFVQKGNHLWIVDVDNIKDGTEMLEEFINKMESGYETNIVYKMPTKSGIHLITHPFNIQQFNQEWNYDLEKLYGKVDIKKNRLTLLYENM